MTLVLALGRRQLLFVIGGVATAEHSHEGGPMLTGFFLGNLARSNLYYSAATGTLLGRAVHCNVGRPALWVFPPSA